MNPWPHYVFVSKEYRYAWNTILGKLLYLSVEVSRQQGKFLSTFSSLYADFDSFLATGYKVNMIYPPAYWCFKICSDWTKFHKKLNFLKHLFLKNGYPFFFTNKYFKTVVNKSVMKRIQLTTVEKKTLILPLPYEGDIFLQTRTKLRKSFKYFLNCCKLQIILSQRELAIFFRFKDCLPFDLVYRVVYKYTCGRRNSSYYGETERHLKVRFGEHIGIPPLTFRKVKPSKKEWNSLPSPKFQ